MKQLFNFFLTLFLIALFSFTAYCTTWTVNVADFAFSPANLPNVIVGDTIKWQWQSGNHTTTSVTIPAGALTWDSQITQLNQTFIYVVTVSGSYQYKCTPHFPTMVASFTASVIGITPIQGEVPSKFSLEQNYPNPFNPSTEIKFAIPRSSFVKLTVMNIVGQVLEVLHSGELGAGTYAADWNATAYPSGIYFYRLDAGSFSQTRKMILIK